MDSKKWWESRTICANLAIVGLMALLAALEVIASAGPIVTGTTVLAAAIAALNVALRFVTSVPITVNNNSGPIANVGETFTGPARIGAVAGGNITGLTTSSAVTPPVTLPASGEEPKL